MNPAYVAFEGEQRIAAGDLPEVARAAKQLLDRRRPIGSSAYVYSARETRAQFIERQAAAIRASLEDE